MVKKLNFISEKKNIIILAIVKVEKMATFLHLTFFYSSIKFDFLSFAIPKRFFFCFQNSITRKITPSCLKNIHMKLFSSQ